MLDLAPQTGHLLRSLGISYLSRDVLAESCHQPQADVGVGYSKNSNIGYSKTKDFVNLSLFFCLQTFAWTKNKERIKNMKNDGSKKNEDNSPHLGPLFIPSWFCDHRNWTERIKQQRS